LAHPRVSHNVPEIPKTPGTFAYRCNFHQQMKGTIVVTGNVAQSPKPGQVVFGVAALVTLAASPALACSSCGRTLTSGALGQGIVSRLGKHQNRGRSRFEHRKPAGSAAAMRDHAFAAESTA
jgi:hypothetical protein